VAAAPPPSFVKRPNDAKLSKRNKRKCLDRRVGRAIHRHSTATAPPHGRDACLVAERQLRPRSADASRHHVSDMPCQSYAVIMNARLLHALDACASAARVKGRARGQSAWNGAQPGYSTGRHGQLDRLTAVKSTAKSTMSRRCGQLDRRPAVDWTRSRSTGSIWTGSTRRTAAPGQLHRLYRSKSAHLPVYSTGVRRS
jgi:hypothetical protein